MEKWQLFLLAYLSCMWCSFGAYAVGSDSWSFREAFGKTIHGANAGMIFALLGAEVIGFEKPWRIIGVACGISAGFVRRGELGKMLLDLVKRMLR